VVIVINGIDQCKLIVVLLSVFLQLSFAPAYIAMNRLILSCLGSCGNAIILCSDSFVIPLGTLQSNSAKCQRWLITW